jgi:hypothetical protein
MTDRPSKTAAEKKSERSRGIEDQILEAQKKREERLFLEELAKRIPIARDGKQFSLRKDYSKALTAYRHFLQITAKSLHVEINDLRPGLFDERSRTAESLLMSSIVFDILKILDKLDTPTAKEERKQFHKLFIRFTVGQAFQMFAAENLRKYLVYRKTVRNKAEFWATYQEIKVKKFCAVATWAFSSEDAPEVRRLRVFRDEVLSRRALGRAFVGWYYRHGMTIVAVLSVLPGAQASSKKLLAFAVRRL